MSDKALERLTLALGQDSSIATTQDGLMEHPGNDPKYLDALGLENRYLKDLEKMGKAIKTYTKNIWVPGEVDPDGFRVQPGSTHRSTGMKVRWLLLKD